jgi:hypothetical protein
LKAVIALASFLAPEESPKFLALPFAAVLIICGLPRAQVVSESPVVATQKGSGFSSPKTNFLQVENGLGPTRHFAFVTAPAPFSNTGLAGTPERVTFAKTLPPKPSSKRARTPR